jgi:putative ABC transport system permease protein
MSQPAAHPLVRFAIWTCPPHFRDVYGCAIVRDAAERHLSPVAVALDLIYQGLLTRFEDTVRDIRFGARTLWHSPLYALVASLTVSLAIAANVAVTSVLVHVLLQPLPYPDANRLVFITSGAPGLANQPFSYLDSRDIAKQLTNSLQAFGISSPTQTAPLTGVSQPVVIQGNDVTPGYFNALGVHPALGRTFSPSDLGTHNVIISDHLWRTYFRATPSIKGRTLQLDRVDHTVIGVMDPGFRDVTPSGLVQRDFWSPIDPAAAVNQIRGTISYNGWGLVRRNVSLASAQADLDRAIRALIKRYPVDHPDWGRPSLSPAVDVMVAPVRPMLWLLYSAVVLLLMIACANVTNLNLARAAARLGELNIREALGATRVRLAAQLGWEMALICVAGGVVGIAFGSLVLHIFATVAERLIPRWEGVGINVSVIGYVAVVLFVVTVVSGVIPALFSPRDLAKGLKTADRSGHLGLSRVVRIALVVGEIALVLALVLSAGLIVRSFIALTNVPIGFDGADLSLADAPSLPYSRYPNHFAGLHAMTRIAVKLRAISGVNSVAITSSPPFEIEENTFTTFGKRRLSEPVDINVVSPEYFETMRIPLRSGRSFAANDQFATPQVAIVNATLAREFFGTVNVVGCTYDPHIGWKSREIRTIIGVAADTRSGFRAPNTPLQYLVTNQVPGIFGFFAIRTDGEYTDLAQRVARAYTSVDPQFPKPRLRPYMRIFADYTAIAHLAALLFGCFALIALLLGVAGIYAVTGYTVEQRRHEFGIRKALGAREHDLIADVLMGALRMCALGITFGLILAGFGTQLLAGLLFRTAPLDPFTFTFAILLVVVSSLIAALVPALQASRVQPAAALRYE